MSPLVNILTDLFILLLTAILTKCGLDVKAHMGDISAVGMEVAGGVATGIVLLCGMAGKWLREHEAYLDSGQLHGGGVRYRGVTTIESAGGGGDGKTYLPGDKKFPPSAA